MTLHPNSSHSHDATLSHAPTLSTGAEAMLTHLRTHGPRPKPALVLTFGPMAPLLIRELQSRWLVLQSQGDGTRVGRHGLMQAAPVGTHPSPLILKTYHHRLRGQVGTLAHYGRFLGLTPGDTLAVLRALADQGLASGSVTGATVTCRVHL